MSNAPEVDFSQIRGDWHFHLNYLANAQNQMLKWAEAHWPEVAAEANNPAIGELLEKIRGAWDRLNETGNDKDPLDVNSPLLDEFIALANQGKEPCDALEETKGIGGSASHYDTPLERFTEAMRGVRSFGEDFIMMREQKP